MVDGRSTEIPPLMLPISSVSLLRAGMKLAMHGLQLLLIDMRVHLRGRYVRVPQHLLDDSQISAVAEQMRCEAMTQKVRIDVLLQSGQLRVLLNDLPDPHCG